MSSLPLVLALLLPAAYAQEAAVVPAPAAEPVPEPAPAPVRYRLDPAAGQLMVQVSKVHGTVAAGFAHDHIVVARGWTGSVTWSATDASACVVDIRVPVDQLEVDAPAMRAQVGLEGDLGDGTRQDVRQHMLEEDQLDGAHHPEISFHASSCSGTEGPVTVTGTLEIHGVARSVSAPMTVAPGPDGFRAQGSLQLRTSDFGITPFTALLGTVRVADELTLTVDVVGSRSQATGG